MFRPDGEPDKKWPPAGGRFVLAGCPHLRHLILWNCGSVVVRFQVW
jgi:hypothetical protein